MVCVTLKSSADGCQHESKGASLAGAARRAGQFLFFDFYSNIGTQVLSAHVFERFQREDTKSGRSKRQ